MEILYMEFYFIFNIAKRAKYVRALRNFQLFRTNTEKEF